MVHGVLAHDEDAPHDEEYESEGPGVGQGQPAKAGKHYPVGTSW
jgi:hypothetical protein